MTYIFKNIVGTLFIILLSTLSTVSVASELLISVKGGDSQKCFAEQTSNATSFYVFCHKPYYLSMQDDNTSVFGRFNQTGSDGTLHVVPDGLTYIEIIPDA